MLLVLGIGGLAYMLGQQSAGTPTLADSSVDGGQSPSQDATNTSPDASAEVDIGPDETATSKDAGPGEMVDSSDPPTVEPGPAVGEKALPARVTIDFEPLALDEPVTSMDMSDDGRYVIFTHQAANLISVFDVLQQKVLYSRSSTAPRSVLCRNGQAYIANFGEGTISVYSQGNEWRRTNQLQVIKPGIVHLSAPSGSYFANELLVTCHGEGNQASYQDSHIYLVDTQADKCREVANAALATTSFDGNLVVTQGSFNLSPSGGIAAYNYDEFMQLASQAKRVYAGGVLQTPYVYQSHPGGYWLGGNIVFGGVPLAEIPGDMGKLIVPDLSQKLIYTLTQDIVRAHRLNTSLTELGMRKARYPVVYYRDFPKVSHNIYRQRGYLLDHSIAFTHGDQTHFFVLVADGGIVLHTVTPAFLTVEKDHGELVQRDNEPNALPPEMPLPTAPAEPAGPAGLSSVLLKDLPSMIPAGRPWEFQIRLPENVKVELMSEVPGMSLSAEGLLAWRPGQQHVGMHELKIRFESNGSSAFERPQIEVIDPELYAAVDGDLSKLNQFQSTPLSVDRYTISESRDGQHALLLQGDVLRIMAGDGVSIEATRQLPHRYDFMEERDDVYIAVAQSPAPTLDVIDKNSLRVRKKVNLATGGERILEITDLAIHPQTGTSYVAIKHDIELPRYKVLVVNESAGRVLSPDIIGNFIEVSPDGSRLYTGYRDIYQRGSHFHINPGWQLIEVPEYGSVDMLLVWDSKRFKLKQAIRSAGGNGNGIRLSRDGQRLVYLSHVGFPGTAGNLVGVAATDFDDRAVVYETKGRGTTKELAFHPTLPMIAVPGSGSAILFHRETGQVLSNRLLLTASGLGSVNVQQLYFSPDGRNLVFVCEGGETGRYLRSVKLKLTEQELRITSEPPRPVVTAVPDKPDPVPENELDAIVTMDLGEMLSAKEIGRRYLDAVVLILTEDGSGTGFFIGKTGYLLTAEHVVTGVNELEVVYNFKSGTGEYQPLRTKGQVVYTDELHDLALVKIESSKELDHVVLLGDEQVETGEVVTVIGNPALGSQILNRTMTTGIISNPDRNLDGLHFVQTTAAINPGNSGGPMFDSHGRVIGLVSLKGNIDGTGFAVPADVIRRFLKKAVEATK
ncbi:MAG: trypsin-like peptidase domain-containing protein [Planctomycetaceae bacterium]